MRGCRKFLRECVPKRVLRLRPRGRLRQLRLLGLDGGQPQPMAAGVLQLVIALRRQGKRGVTCLSAHLFRSRLRFALGQTQGTGLPQHGNRPGGELLLPPGFHDLYRIRGFAFLQGPETAKGRRDAHSRIPQGVQPRQQRPRFRGLQGGHGHGFSLRRPGAQPLQGQLRRCLDIQDIHLRGSLPAARNRFLLARRIQQQLRQAGRHGRAVLQHQLRLPRQRFLQGHPRLGAGQRLRLPLLPFPPLVLGFHRQGNRLRVRLQIERAHLRSLGDFQRQLKRLAFLSCPRGGRLAVRKQRPVHRFLTVKQRAGGAFLRLGAECQQRAKQRRQQAHALFHGSIPSFVILRQCSYYTRVWKK